MHKISAAMVLLMLAACSTDIKVKELPTGFQPGDSVDGLPFRMAKRYTATLYEKRPDGYKQVLKQDVTQPDMERVLILGFVGQPLANGTIDVSYSPMGTLTNVSLVSQQQGSKALEAAGNQLKATATAVEARLAAREARPKAEAAELTAATALVIEAEKARLNAELLQLQRELLEKKSDATEDQKKAAQNAERLAKIDANEKARQAARPPFFPDVVLP